MTRRGWLTASLVLLAIMGIAAELLLPIVIRNAYRGSSLPVLNRLIVGQEFHPLEHYLALGRRGARIGLAALGGLWILLALVSHPSVAARLAKWLRVRESGDPSPVLPTPNRRRAVAVLAFVIAAGSLAEMAADPPWTREHWPFSPYQMYSDMPRKTLLARRLYGVTSRERGLEIPLSDEDYLRPFDHSRMWSTWDALDGSARREKLMPAALTDFLDRYESRRLRGEHDGPRLEAVRLYKVYWADPRFPDQKVPNRELLWEVPASTQITLSP